MISVTHIISGLSTGGAEMMLLKLLTHADRDQFESRVYCLSAEVGPIADRLEGIGVPVRVLGMSRGRPNPLDALRLSGWLSRTSPHVVQTWMYHADLVGGAAAKLAAWNVPVIWGIQNSTLDPTRSRARTIWVARACAKASTWLPETIVCCSENSRRVHAALGYADHKFRVIPNGIDLAAFRPDAEARAAVRRELGVPDDAPLVGIVARFDPQKDHRTFVEAAGRLRARLPDAHFLLCGRGATPDNRELGAWIDAAGIRGSVHLLGERTDVPRITAALDLLTLSSAFGEAFPNVLGEAMACEVVCVTTDVGDSAYIVGDTGRVVPSRDPGALADAWHSLLAGDRDALRALGRRARQRVRELFTIQRVTRAYEDTYRAAVAPQRAEARA
jgi:glycosyltransferase involved in cell wall biosynthesis